MYLYILYAEYVFDWCSIRSVRKTALFLLVDQGEFVRQITLLIPSLCVYFSINCSSSNNTTTSDTGLDTMPTGRVAQFVWS